MGLSILLLLLIHIPSKFLLLPFKKATTAFIGELKQIDPSITIIISDIKQSRLPFLDYYL